MAEEPSAGSRADTDVDEVVRRLQAVVEEGKAAIAAGDFRTIRSVEDLDRLLTDLSSHPTRVRDRGAA